MKFKFDENIGSLDKAELASARYDVMTVLDQSLGGASDQDIYSVFRDEGRILVTLDHDFSHTLRFPPSPTAEIAILERRGRLSPQSILSRMSALLKALQIRPIAGELWIVDAYRVRIHGDMP